MKQHLLLASVLAALVLSSGLSARANNMASLSISPGTGTATLTPRWAIGDDLAGFHYMAQDLSLGGGPTQFYSLTSAAIPPGGDVLGFYRYLPASGAAVNHADIGSKLTPNSYSALTGADPDLGYGAVQFYFIHHKTDGDYFTHLVPGSGVSSSVADLKPMSQPGGPSTGGAKGYFGLAFAASDLGFGPNLFYYLRTDAVTGFAVFGSLVPALAGTATDRFDLGRAGHNALAYTATDVGYGMDQLYFLRLDPVTHFTILGTFNPTTGHPSDVANLGSVYDTLTFVPGDVGFGTNKFYVTGTINPAWQSVSFASIANRNLTQGPFTVAPTASSGLPIALTVVPSSTGAATISGPVGGVFTVTPTAVGRISLQATQAGQTSPVPYEFNMLRQSFSVVALPGDPFPTAPGDVFPGDDYTPPVVVVPPPIPPGDRLPLLCDFNHDGNSDLVWRNVRTGVVQIWFMKGHAILAKRTLSRRILAKRVFAHSTPQRMQIAAAGDFNGDGRTDLAWRDSLTGKITISIMRGARIRSQHAIASRTEKSKKIFAAGDFDTDGKTDLVWRNAAQGNVGVWFLRGSNHLGSRLIASGVRGREIAGTGDFDSDGSIDILLRNPADGQLSLWFMKGTTIVSKGAIAGGKRAWQIAATGDFSRDGRPDLVLRRSATIRLWLMNGAKTTSREDIRKRAPAWEIRN